MFAVFLTSEHTSQIVKWLKGTKLKSKVYFKKIKAFHLNVQKCRYKIGMDVLRNRKIRSSAKEVVATLVFIFEYKKTIRYRQKRLFAMVS